MSAEIRQVERDRKAAEPSHLAELVRFTERAYRRPLSQSEKEEVLAFYRKLRGLSRDREGAEEATAPSRSRLGNLSRDREGAEEATAPSRSRLRREEEVGHEEALRDTLASVLLSPHFCYRFDFAERGTRAIRPLSDYELASRLSYFLWSSLPDAELLSHADKGDLHQTDVIKAQARRMLHDPKTPRSGRRVCRQLARFSPLRGTQQRRSTTISELHQ